MNQGQIRLRILKRRFLRRDKKFKHVFVEYPQPKGSKIKLAAFGAGVDRHSDWFVALADYLVLQPDRAIYSEDAPAWFLPALQKTGSPGTTRWATS